MKQKKSISFLALLLIMACCFSLGANASNGLQEIKAYLNANITVKLDGNVQTFADANGSRLYPITYNGSTYLPIRSVSNMLGIDVDWDGDTQTVLLGKQPSGVDLIDTLTPYDRQTWHDARAGQVQTKDEQTEDISGVPYTHWIYFETRFNPSTSSLAYNLQGKYSTLTFSYYSVVDSKLRVLGDDGKVLGEYDVVGGAIAKTVTIPLFNTKELRFEMELGQSFCSARIMDVYLDAET